MMGLLFIISAPSGAGKSTLCRALRARFQDLAFSVSYTTRSARPGEEHGRDYFFISPDTFENGVKTKRWAEWARVHDHYYGTCAKWIDETLNNGTSILLDIDVQGMRQLKRRFPEAVTIFIMPPDLTTLENRLRKRGTDDEATIGLRLRNAQQEMAQKECYDYNLINDELEQAIQDLIGIVDRHQNRAEQP